MPAYTGGSGYRFELTFVYEDGTPINLTTATGAWAVLLQPDGTEVEYERGAGLVVDDGAAGTAHVDITAGEMAEPGRYTMQGWVSDADGRGPIPSEPVAEQVRRSPTTAPV